MSPRRVLIVSGLSGAGKASILRTLEDLGYEAVDNPPLTLLEALVTRGDRPLAVGLDARSAGFDAQEILAGLDRLQISTGVRPELIFAWADETVLLRRYTETRRRHPMAPQGRVADGIAAEATLTRTLRDAAVLEIDTSGLPLAELRRVIELRFGQAEGTQQRSLTLSLVSFAFPAGLPREADMVFDARFLRNPHYDPILRSRTGIEPAVARYIEEDEDFPAFFAQIITMLRLVLPRFVREGKKYATVGVGCTGGQHRSVHIVQRLCRELTEGDGARDWNVIVSHRELLKAEQAQVATQAMRT